MRTTVNAELNDHLIAKITSFIKPFYNMAFLKGKKKVKKKPFSDSGSEAN